jgi:outer membrane protein TolC
MRYQRLILIFPPLLLLASCMVGPKYAKPTVPIPQPDTYKELDGWKTAQPNDEAIRRNWWEIFGDPPLNSLEEQVLLSNQDLKAAEARFFGGSVTFSV